MTERTVTAAAYTGDIVSRLRSWRGLHLAHSGRLYDEAADEIERLRNERRWIPVSERLPEDGKWVLWFNKSWDCPIVVARRDDKSLDWGGDLCGTLHGFTHWQPLAEPPEVK
jgi:hypothetical protein